MEMFGEALGQFILILGILLFYIKFKYKLPLTMT